MFISDSYNTKLYICFRLLIFFAHQIKHILTDLPLFSIGFLSFHRVIRSVACHNATMSWWIFHPCMTLLVFTYFAASKRPPLLRSKVIFSDKILQSSSCTGILFVLNASMNIIQQQVIAIDLLLVRLIMCHPQFRQSLHSFVLARFVKHTLTLLIIDLDLAS